MLLRALDLDLPEDLELPLRSGAAHWYWLGGRPALDLVNTLRERWRRRVDTLVTTDDLAAWLVQSGLLPGPMPVRRAALDETRDLREAIDAGVRAAVAGDAPPDEAVRVIDGWLVHAGTRPSLALIGGEPTLGERPAADSPRRALGTVALDAATMLGLAEQRARVRICAGDSCSARFYDRSPAGRRRWCSMRTCGNAAKARRHRDRRRAAA
ncbi:MAG: CGNR zinc finger domain-containing protein [Solirubrobacteraceae bacterium]